MAKNSFTCANCGKQEEVVYASLDIFIAVEVLQEMTTQEVVELIKQDALFLSTRCTYCGNKISIEILDEEK